MTTLVHVPVALLPQVLQVTKRWVGRIIETDPDWMNEEQAVERLLSNHLQLHLAVDENNTAIAALVTELKVTPTGMKVCLGHGLAGFGRHLWMHHLPEMEAWAKREGCRRFVVPRGRKGWLKEPALKAHYGVTYTFERELT